ncbi:carbohydrate ABC transporter substrate-binding protein [Clostridium botulinum]|uniref:Carbohydrate ABC transporter substrate-binding protein n=3 Tax=Clostridium botulinum TaxID=1491 RepID=A0A0L9Y7K0_CLOBO|nr:ABC transporter substrate-binding protein [Clostridium botulinum]KAI3345055.1 ABC transporter substrate-binding protein [Clostridium botulinum]KOM87696.1 ABC transporter substrate-binding protein [Clostridium botulinum]KOR63624.1 ABC transporter substrate-binding protein [Clostridium botulinum]MCS6112275.1 carbohydrate ABC transporter substrate-binding protein [Clostridium botulinum]NFE13010.1 carbohydrate ABC transporter substrate-binding protein [Clostridium botulinum]
MKLRMRKTLATVLAASLLIGTVAGCSSSNAGNSAKKDGEGKTVKVFQLKVEINDQLKELAKKYEDETGVKVDITSVGGGADYGAALKAEFQKGTAPDIFMIQGAGDYGVWQEKIDNLTDEPWVKDAFHGTLDTVTVDGKVYGMPAATEGYGLMYNKDILDKAGIDPASIDTFDKLKAAFEKLDSMKAELGIDNVVSYTTKETWVTGNHTFNIPLAVQKDSAQFVKDYVAGKADFVNNQYFKDWMNLVELLCKYGGGPTLDTIDYTTQVGNFGALHKTAFLHQGNWTSKDLAGLDANFPKGFVPLAINNDPKISGSIPVGVPMYWVVNKESAVNKEAKDFLNWMVTSEAGQNCIVKDMKMIPAFTNFAVEPEDELAKSIVEFNKAGKTIPWAFTNLPDGFTMNNIGPIFSKFARGEIDKNQMLQQLQDATK